MLKDLRHSLRGLARTPGFTAVAVLALALGIGANTAIFSVVNGVLLHPLPYVDADRIVVLEVEDAAKGFHHFRVAPADFLDWREQNSVFERIAAYTYSLYTLTGAEEPEQVSGSKVTAGFFHALGIKPILGRDFLPEEEKPGAEPVVLLSHSLWQRRFGSDPAIVGRPIALGKQRRTVIGVAPPGFHFPREKTELWEPLVIRPGEQRFALYLEAIARLKTGVPLERARAEMTAIARRLAQEYPKTNATREVRVLPLLDSIVGPVRPVLLVLLGAVGFVLLIACANVANLLLARAATRRKEIALRAAMGAGRWRLVRQLLTESLLLASIGGGAGLLLALWGVHGLAALIPPTVPRAKEIGIDSAVLAFTLLLSLATGVLFGLAPALRASRPNLLENLKESGLRVAGALGSTRTRNLLAAAQVALAVVLLAGAGLLIRSFLLRLDVELGFDPRNVLTVELSRFDSRAMAGALDRIRALPGVVAAGVADALPHLVCASAPFSIEGRAIREPQNPPESLLQVAGPDYFRALRIPLRSGRFLTDVDASGAPPVAVMNETMARRFFAGQDPIGSKVRVMNSAVTIVGVVGDTRYFGMQRDTRPALYLSYLQSSGLCGEKIVVRTAGAPALIAGAVRNEVRAADKNAIILEVSALEQRMSQPLASPRFYMLLLSIFAALALVLAATGVYGVLSYSVVQRTHEIGVRLALGAGRGAVLGLVLRHGAVVIAAGLALGLAGAWAATRLLANLLYRIQPADPVTFCAVALLLAAVGLLACYLPARAATRVDPIVALRYE